MRGPQRPDDVICNRHTNGHVGHVLPCRPKGRINEPVHVAQGFPLRVTLFIFNRHTRCRGHLKLQRSGNIGRKFQHCGVVKGLLSLEQISEHLSKSLHCAGIAAGQAITSVLAFQQSRKLGDVDGDPPRLVFCQHLGLHRFGFAVSRIDVGQNGVAVLMASLVVSTPRAPAASPAVRRFFNPAPSLKSVLAFSTSPVGTDYRALL
jgi:hypothetical protein